MQITPGQKKQKQKSGATAYTLIEILVATAVLGVTFLSVYGAFSTGFAVIQVARENLRATQILQEKMETIRLYTWDQITNNGFIPPTFTAAFYPAGSQTNNQGATYQGTVTISAVPPPLSTASYAKDMKMVVVQ